MKSLEEFILNNLILSQQHWKKYLAKAHDQSIAHPAAFFPLIQVIRGVLDPWRIMDFHRLSGLIFDIFLRH